MAASSTFKSGCVGMAEAGEAGVVWLGRCLSHFQRTKTPFHTHTHTPCANSLVTCSLFGHCKACCYSQLFVLQQSSASASTCLFTWCVFQLSTVLFLLWHTLVAWRGTTAQKAAVGGQLVGLSSEPASRTAHLAHRAHLAPWHHRNMVG